MTIDMLWALVLCCLSCLVPGTLAYRSKEYLNIDDVEEVTDDSLVYEMVSRLFGYDRRDGRATDKDIGESYDSVGGNEDDISLVGNVFNSFRSRYQVIADAEDENFRLI